MRLYTRKAYTKAIADLKSAENYIQWLRALRVVLNTPQYSKEVPTAYDRKTGNPSSFKKVVDRTSTSPRWAIICRSIPEQGYNPQVTQALTSLHHNLKLDNRPVIYQAQDSKLDPPNNQSLVVTLGQISTGGGHNDSPTYADALKFSLVSATHTIL